MKQTCSWVAFAWVLLALVGCQKQDPLHIPGGGAGFLFQINQAKSGGQAAMVEAVRRRLDAEGILKAQVSADGTDGIRVLVPAVDVKAAERIEQALTLPTLLAIAEVDDGKEFFASMKEKLPADKSVALASDGYGTSGPEAGRETWYLAAADRGKLDAFLGSIHPPEGRRLAVLPSRAGPLAYLLVEPAAVENPVLQAVKVFEDPVSGQAAIGAELAQPFRQLFAELTRRTLHRRLAIVINSEIRSLPVVQTPIESGQLRIDPSPISEPTLAKTQAEALAAGLNAWGLAASLKLVRKEITPAQ